MGRFKFKIKLEKDPFFPKWMRRKIKHKNVKFMRIFNTLTKNKIFFVMSKGRQTDTQVRYCRSSLGHWPKVRQGREENRRTGRLKFKFKLQKGPFSQNRKHGRTNDKYKGKLEKLTRAFTHVWDIIQVCVWPQDWYRWMVCEKNERKT